MEGTRVERDPTMDNRIVHAVSVSNKKEQSHLRDRESAQEHKEYLDGFMTSSKTKKESLRQKFQFPKDMQVSEEHVGVLSSADQCLHLQHEFVVEQHIIRREEKSLLKQFQKLQLEKYHRHEDEMHSPRSRHLILPRSAHSRNSSHRVLVNTPKTSRHLMLPQHVKHHPSLISHASTKHSSHPSSSLISYNASSHAYSGHSLNSTCDVSLPTIDSKVRHGVSPESGHRRATEDAHHRHRSRGAMNEIESLVESYMVPHQPAGYGHSMKASSEQKDHRRYRARKNKHDHRRPSHIFDYPGNYYQVGNLHLLNGVGPNSGTSVPSRLAEAICHDKTPEDETSHTGDRQLDGSLALKDTSKITTVNFDNDSPTANGHETIEKEKKTSFPEKLEINIQIKRNKRQNEKLGATLRTSSNSFLREEINYCRHVISLASFAPAPKKPHQGVTTSSALDGGAVHTVSRANGEKSARNSYHGIHRQAANHNHPPGTAETTGCRELVPFVRNSHSKEDIQKRSSFVSQATTRSKNKHHEHQGGKVQETTGNFPQDFELAASTLAELESICGSSTQGYHSRVGGFGNRRARFKQLVKELLLKQMPTVARKRHLAEFDPLEALQCRYLRLSPSNIEELVAACKEAGVDVELHPHSNVTDINEHVFGKK